MSRQVSKARRDKMQLAQLEASSMANLFYASKEIEKMTRETHYGSGFIITIQTLGLDEKAKFMIADGFSKETAIALLKDIERTQQITEKMFSVTHEVRQVLKDVEV